MVSENASESRAASLQEGENGVVISSSICCANNSEISTNARKADSIIKLSIVAFENICKNPAETVAGALLKTSVIHFGSFAGDVRETKAVLFHGGKDHMVISPPTIASRNFI